MTMGRAIPALLFLVFLADIGARFLPVDPLTFRGWEALSRYRPPGAAFEPNRRYVQARSYGDSAAMGNLPELRQYRPETFTTDARGFRNTSTAGAAPVAAILAGDSFAVGSGVADHDTLSVTLSRQLGCSVYNAAGMDPDPDRLRALAAELGLSRGLVLHAYAEDVEAPTVPPGGKRALNQTIAAATASVDRAIGLVRGFLLVSPLRILSERAFKRLANDRILPNSYASSVIKGTLRNGDPMLFIASRVARVRGDRSVSAAYWLWMQQELQAAGLGLVVVLIPSKYTVYRDLLVDQPQRERGEAGFLEQLEHALRAANVPVLNLTRALSAEAARRAARHDYLSGRTTFTGTAKASGSGPPRFCGTRLSPLSPATTIARPPRSWNPARSTENEHAERHRRASPSG
jgi:hypothetical protein